MMARSDPGLPPGLLQVAPGQRRTTQASVQENEQLWVPPGVLGYNAAAAAVAAAAAAAAAASSPAIQRDSGAQLPSSSPSADSFPVSTPETNEEAASEPAAAPGTAATQGQATATALKLELHLKRPFHLGLKSLAHPDRDDMEHDLVSELCEALGIEPANVELLNVSRASAGPIQAGSSVRTSARRTSKGSELSSGNSAPAPLTLQNEQPGSGVPLSDFDMSTLKSFACMFHCDDHGHLRVREIVSRLRANISLRHLLARPVQLGGGSASDIAPTSQSLDERFSSMYVEPGTVSTFEEIIRFFGTGEEQYIRYTAAHPVALKTLFLKDFEVSYAQKAFSGMDVSDSTFVRRSFLIQASAVLSNDLRDRFDAFGDEYINEVEFVHILDSVHGEFMSAWSFKQLLEQLEKGYLRLLSK